MRKEWKEPKLELLDVKETMLGWKHNHHDLFVEGFSDDHGLIPNPKDPGSGGSGS